MKTIVSKVILFTACFTVIFFLIRFYNLLPPAKLTQNINSIPWLFSAISLIFSIISGFVIQAKWHTWDELTDATHGELSSFRQLHILAHHFPTAIQKKIKEKICVYLTLILAEARKKKHMDERSPTVEQAIYQMEETVFNINYTEHPNIGAMAFDLVRKCIDYREKRLQTSAHKLPLGVRLFVVSTTFAIIFSSLFIGVDSLVYDYMFTLIIALLSYGIYLLIDDLDNPYRPGQWHLKIDPYEQLLHEIQNDSPITV